MTLEGTLNLPKNAVKVPAVVIANGLGQDRNGIYLPDPNLCPPIYKTWADTLAQYGIAVLRYDQRITRPYMSHANFSLTDRVNDISSAVKYLKHRAEIDTNKIFIVGHSEGADVAPIAEQTKNIVKGLVLIAATAFAIDTFTVEYLKASNADPAYISRVEELFAALREGEYSASWRFNDRGPSYWEQYIQYTENAGTTAVNLGKPILIIQGANDEYFPGSLYQKNTAIWENTASQSSLIDLRIYQGVTHFLLRHGARETSVNVLHDLIEWIK